MLKKIDERYSINEKGEVFRDGGIKVLSRWHKGAEIVHLENKSKRVYTLLLEAFVGSCPKYHVATCKNNNRRDMNLKNWMWDWTPSVKKRKEISAANQVRIAARMEKNRLNKEEMERAKVAFLQKIEDKANIFKIKAQAAKERELPVSNSEARSEANPNLPSFRLCEDCGKRFRTIRALKCPKCRVVKPYLMRYSI